MYMNGEIELELNPLGNIGERLRSGGAGVPAYYGATGVGTWVEEGKIVAKYKKGSKGKEVEKYQAKPQVRVFNGKRYILVPAFYPDFGFVRAWRADGLGNLQFRGCSRNANADVAISAAKRVIVEVEELLDIGQIPPDHIHVPSIYVDRMFKYQNKLKEPEVIILKDEFVNKNKKITPAERIRQKIAKRAAQELKDGWVVNLGIGIPTLVPVFLGSDTRVFLQGENGVLGIGDYPATREELDPDLINPGKQGITLDQGASLFSLSQSFAMIRGGHLDATIIGAMEADRECNIASWIVPGKLMKGMGGAMDLTNCGSKIIVTMQHKDNKGRTKVLNKCSLPLTQKGKLDVLVTEMGVYKPRDGELHLEEIASEYTLEQVKAATGWDVKVSDNLKTF